MSVILPSSIVEIIQSARNHGQIVVLATGVFDLFHQEHQNFLDKAKANGDVLIVGLECDARVRAMKGEGRPVWDQEKRLQVLRGYDAVDGAFILPENFGQREEIESLMSQIHPDILAVSSHTPYLDRKQVMAEKYGGKLVIVHQHNPQVSTTKLLAETE